MTIRRLTVSTLAALLAITGIGSILSLNQAPRQVDAIELSDEVPAIRRDDDDGQGLDAVDDDDDAGGDGTGDANTGDGDATEGDDGTSGGDNTGDAAADDDSVDDASVDDTDD